MELLSIATDTDASENGKWFQYPSSEIEFLIARAGNTKHSAFLKQLEDDDRVGWKAFKDVLLDWKNVEINKKKVKFSDNQLKKMAEDERYAKVFTWISGISLAEENYRVQAINEMGEK